MNNCTKIVFLFFFLFFCGNAYAQKSDSTEIKALSKYNNASYIKLLAFSKEENIEALYTEFLTVISYNDSVSQQYSTRSDYDNVVHQKLNGQKYAYMTWALKLAKKLSNDDLIAGIIIPIKTYIENIGEINNIAYIKACNTVISLLIKYDYLLEANTYILQTQQAMDRNPSFEQTKEGLLFLQNQARYHTAAGSRRKASISYKKLIATVNEMLKTEAWKENKDLLSALGASHSDLAILYQDTKYHAIADSLYGVALHYYELSGGKDSKDYTTVLSHKLFNEITYQINSGEDYDFDKYESKCKELISLRAKSYGTKHPNYGGSLVPLMELYWANEMYEPASDLLRQSLEIERSQNNVFSHYYKKLLFSYSGLYEAQGKIDSSFLYYQASNKLTIDHIRTVFSSVSYEQQSTLLGDISYKFYCFYSFGDRYLDSDTSELAEEFVNIDIAFKGLSLEKNTNLKKIALSNKDTVFKKMYSDWISTRQRLFRAMNAPTHKNKAEGIDIEELKEQVEVLGSNIGTYSRFVEGAVSNTRLIDFKKIKNSLKTDEACVDFIDFPYHNGRTWEQYRLYYAAIILPNQEKPILIKLGTNQDLYELLGNEINKNGSNYISEDDISNDLYNLIWAPLEEHLESSKQIYVCPTGLLHKVAFNSLLNNDDERLLQVYNLHYINSLRNIIHIKEHKKEIENHKICLVGAANFDSFEKEKNKKTAVADTVLNKLSADDQRAHASSFSYLQGTKIEINQIETLLKKEQWAINKLEGVEATEEAIKSLEQVESPQILHIASHGFFFDKEYKGFDCHGCMLGSIGNKPPLYRSGIALTGANKVWLGRERDSTHQEDGILTAYEVASMDLSQTELVVLSACETGRGDLGAEGGVLGLQRAFKLAGAKQLIFSLWKVPDRQTAELMKLFYSYYSESKNIHLAFQKAQRDMSKKYNNPYYWAAFVLLE